jgi:hypothetical protein
MLVAVQGNENKIHSRKFMIVQGHYEDKKE